jgi:uncharacterized protein
LKYLKTYRIPFSGLAIGKHEFSFDIGKEFFDCYPYSIVKDGDLKADVLLDKQSNMMIAAISINGIIRLDCDVCLREFEKQTAIDTQLIIKFSDEDLQEISDEILVLGRNEYEFSIADVLYEHINVSVPHYVRCDANSDGEGCDEEMIGKLRELSAEVSGEADSSTGEQVIDPRWEKLKNLKKNS